MGQLNITNFDNFEAEGITALLGSTDVTYTAGIFKIVIVGTTTLPNTIAEN